VEARQAIAGIMVVKPGFHNVSALKYRKLKCLNYKEKRLMKNGKKALTALLATTAVAFMAGQAAAAVKPVYNCAGCHQQKAGELWGTLVPGSQADGSFRLQTGAKEIWEVRYDNGSKLDKMATVRDLMDEKAMRVKFKTEGGKKSKKGYAEEVSYKPNYGFKNPDDIITITEVSELLKKSPEEGNYVIFDARGYDNYIEGHLPGAVSLPFYRLQSFKDRLPADKNTQIVSYCRGYG
jgi:hypothetical protein